MITARLDEGGSDGGRYLEKNFQKMLKTQAEAFGKDEMETAATILFCTHTRTWNRIKYMYYIPGPVMEAQIGSGVQDQRGVEMLKTLLTREMRGNQCWSCSRRCFILT